MAASPIGGTPPVISTYVLIADAEGDRVAGVAAALLLGPQLGRSRPPRAPCRACRVVADVVGLADHRGVRLGERGDEVGAADVGGVEAELGANMSIARSMAAVASGRPAPR